MQPPSLLRRGRAGREVCGVSLVLPRVRPCSPASPAPLPLHTRAVFCAKAILRRRLRRGLYTSATPRRRQTVVETLRLVNELPRNGPCRLCWWARRAATACGWLRCSLCARSCSWGVCGLLIMIIKKKKREFYL